MDTKEHVKEAAEKELRRLFLENLLPKLNDILKLNYNSSYEIIVHDGSKEGLNILSVSARKENSKINVYYSFIIRKRKVVIKVGRVNMLNQLVIDYDFWDLFKEKCIERNGDIPLEDFYAKLF